MAIPASLAAPCRCAACCAVLLAQMLRLEHVVCWSHLQAWWVSWCRAGRMWPSSRLLGESPACQQTLATLLVL